MAESAPTGFAPFVTAINVPPFSISPVGDVARIGYQVTGFGPALNVALVGAPVVVNVNLDLIDDEVAIGGPDVGGTRRLFQGLEDTGTGQNVLEVVPRQAAAPTHSRVNVTAVNNPIVAAAAAGVLRRTIIIRNIGDSTGVEVDLVDAGDAFGTGQPLQPGSAVGRYGDSVTLETLGEVRGITAAAGQDVAVTVLNG
jgi:hypothetical protein